MGNVCNTSCIVSTGFGSLAMGNICNSSCIIGNNTSFAMGNVSGSSCIIADNTSFAMGRNGVISTGITSMAMGSNINNGADCAIALGYNLTLNNFIHSGTTAVNKLAIFNTPATSTCTSALVWDNTDKKVKLNSSLGGGGGGITTANNGLTTNGTNVVLGGSLTGNTNVNTNNFGISFGTGTTATGNNSFATGIYTCATGNGSVAWGNGGYVGSEDYLEASGNYSMAGGYKSCSVGNASIALGTFAKSYGEYSIALGHAAHASGNTSIALGKNACAEGNYSVAFSYSLATGNNSFAFGNSEANGNFSFAGGFSLDGFEPNCAGGFNSFIFQNSNGLVSNGGALGNNTAILGGNDNSIAASNTGTTIIGGNNINITSSGFDNFGVVSNLAIWSTPATGAASDSVLTWDATSKKVRAVAYASPSDCRLKTCIEPINGINLGGFSGVRFEYNNLTPNEGKKAYGVLAQEVENTFPLIVNENYTGTDGNKYKTVDYKQLVPILLEKIKELEQRIILLENNS